MITAYLRVSNGEKLYTTKLDNLLKTEIVYILIIPIAIANKFYTYNL